MQFLSATTMSSVALVSAPRITPSWRTGTGNAHHTWLRSSVYFLPNTKAASRFITDSRANQEYRYSFKEMLWKITMFPKTSGFLWAPDFSQSAGVSHWRHRTAGPHLVNNASDGGPRLSGIGGSVAHLGQAGLQHGIPGRPDRWTKRQKRHMLVCWLLIYTGLLYFTGWFLTPDIFKCDSFQPDK